MAHNQPTRIPRWKDVEFENHRVRIYSIGWLSLIAKLTPSNCKRWEKLGILPKPLMQLTGKWRYYLADEILGYSNALSRARISSGQSRKEFDRGTFSRLSRITRAAVRLKAEKSPEELLTKLPQENAIREALKKAPPVHVDTVML